MTRYEEVYDLENVPTIRLEHLINSYAFRSQEQAEHAAADLEEARRCVLDDDVLECFRHLIYAKGELEDALIFLNDIVQNFDAKKTRKDDC